MKNTIKTIALSVAFLSGAGMAYAQDDETPTEVTVDTGLQATLESISQQVENGSALNLAVNTGDVDASVDLQALGEVSREAQDAISSIEGTIETTAIGAANSDETYNYDFSEVTSATNNSETVEELSEVADSSDISEVVSTTLATIYSEQINETLSNYSAANIAYNAGTIDASVSAIAEGTQTAVNNSITTTAIGAVNSGSITVTVK